MSIYEHYKTRANNLKVHKATANNVFSLSSLSNDYEQLTEEMLDTIAKFESLSNELEQLNLEIKSKKTTK